MSDLTPQPPRTPEERILAPIPRPQEEIEEDERARRERLDLRRKFLVRLMKDEQGRVWLRDLLNELQTFNMPLGFGPNGMPDPNGTFVLLGMKQAGWRIWSDLDEADPVLASKLRRATE